MSLKLSDFDYKLPKALIALQPTKRRDESRLMLVDRKTESIAHYRFGELAQLLEDTDLLVLNDTRVFPARLNARAGKSQLEILLLRELEPQVWEALIKPARKITIPEILHFDDSQLQATVVGTTGGSIRIIRFKKVNNFWKTIENIGLIPLPPYITRSGKEYLVMDRKRYQTVYSHKIGSIAAPTAGLHFTTELLDRLQHLFVTLHVGYGTFKPIRSENIQHHSMDTEYYQVNKASALQIEKQRLSPYRIVSVGSTSTRVLEQVFLSHRKIIPSNSWTQLFIFPGFRFRVADCLLTNFHLPKSTLFLLTCAFTGTELLKKAYDQAIQEKYRFYSYGDAMLII